MTRLKAVYRSWAIPCVGKQVYGVYGRNNVGAGDLGV